MNVQPIVSKISPRSIIFITAPSGTGKTTLIRKLIEKHPHLSFCVSHTSRTQRDEETLGKDYHFVNQITFKKMIEENKFLEWVNLSGIFYGTSWKEIIDKIAQKKIIILDIDVQGALYWMSIYESGLYIFLSPPSIEMLETRLRARKTESEQLIQDRLKRSQKEISYKDHWEHIIINKTLDESLLNLEKLIETWST